MRLLPYIVKYIHRIPFTESRLRAPRCRVGCRARDLPARQSHTGPWSTAQHAQRGRSDARDQSAHSRPRQSCPGRVHVIEYHGLGRVHRPHGLHRQSRLAAPHQSREQWPSESKSDQSATVLAQAQNSRSEVESAQIYLSLLWPIVSTVH